MFIEYKQTEKQTSKVCMYTIEKRVLVLLESKKIFSDDLNSNLHTYRYFSDWTYFRPFQDWDKFEKYIIQNWHCTLFKLDLLIVAPRLMRVCRFSPVLCRAALDPIRSKLKRSRVYSVDTLHSTGGNHSSDCCFKK